MSIRLVFVHQQLCPTCASWTTPFYEVARRHPEWNAVKIDVDGEEAKPYEAQIQATPTFRVEGGLNGCVPMFTSDQLKSGPNADVLEQAVLRLIQTMGTGACPRNGKHPMTKAQPQPHKHPTR